MQGICNSKILFFYYNLANCFLVCKEKNFDRYANADFDDAETRNGIFEYFIDKIYVYNDRIVITWYYSGDKTEISLDELAEITDDLDGYECSTLTQLVPFGTLKIRTLLVVRILLCLFLGTRILKGCVLLKRERGFFADPYYVKKTMASFL